MPVGVVDPMLLTLLAAGSSLTVLTSAVLAAGRARAGLGGYIIACSIGFAMAALNGWAVYKVGGLLALRSRSWSTTRQEWSGRVFTFVMVVWLPFAAFLGDQVASAFLR